MKIAQQRAPQREQLALPGAQRRAPRADVGVEEFRGQAHPPQYVQQGTGGLLVERVEVHADGAGDQQRVLGNDRHGSPQGQEADLRHVFASDEDAAGRGVDDPEEEREQTALARATAADDSDALSVPNAQRDAVQ